MISVKFFFQHKKYFASAFLYFCFSLIFSTWVTYIPHIAEKIGITEGRIGKAIFFSALGAFFMIRICRHFVDEVGVGRYTYFALLIYCICFFGPFLAYNYVSLCISLFIFGMAGSSYAISLNSLTAIIQTRLKSQYFFRKGEQPPKEKHKRNNIMPLFVIAIVGLVVMVSEGAIADWSALYLKKIILLDIKYIGFGYSAFSLAMMIGRFTGDSLSKKLGSWQLITYSSLIGIIGFFLVLILNPFFTIPGFFVVGLGFSVIVPEVYRLASNVDGIKTADGVSFIAATTNIGFLVGPVLLGFIAEFRSLHMSFIVLTFWVSLAFFMAFWKYKRKIH